MVVLRQYSLKPYSHASTKECSRILLLVRRNSHRESVGYIDKGFLHVRHRNRNINERKFTGLGSENDDVEEKNI